MIQRMGYRAWFNHHAQTVNFDGLEEFAVEWHDRFFNAPFDGVMAERAATAMYRDILGRQDPVVVILKSPREVHNCIIELANGKPLDKLPSNNESAKALISNRLGASLMKTLRGPGAASESLKIMMSGVESSNIDGLTFMSDYHRNFQSIVPRSLEDRRSDGSMFPDLVAIAHRHPSEACLAAFIIDRCDRESIYRSAAYLVEQSAYFLVFDDRIVISQKPTHVHAAMRTSPKILGHEVSEDHPLLQYSDGFTVSQSRGIVIPSKYLECKPEDIDVKEVMAIEDVDLRAELIRRIGYHRILEKGAGEIVDAGSRKDPNEYQIVMLNLGRDDSDRHSIGRRRLYLKMRHPSLRDLYHFEGVPGRCSQCGLPAEAFVQCPHRSVKADNDGAVSGSAMFYEKDSGCDRVKKAMYFRNQTTEKPRTIV